jgi:biopolymer transport protein ExbD
MAELNVYSQKSNGQVKRKVDSLRVDLTAMVDLAFLLVTFFMLTTTLTKTRAMDLAMPDDGLNEPVAVAQSRTITLCLGKNDKVLWYQGMPSHVQPSVLGFDKHGLRKALMDAKSRIKSLTGKEAIILVKPSSQSKYGNLVNTLDELQITRNTRYAIVNITSQDINLLKQQHIY